MLQFFVLFSLYQWCNVVTQVLHWGLWEQPKIFVLCINNVFSTKYQHQSKIIRNVFKLFLFLFGERMKYERQFTKVIWRKIIHRKKLYKWNKNYHKPVIIQHTNNEALTRSHFKSIQNFVKKKQNILRSIGTNIININVGWSAVSSKYYTA